MNLDSLRHFCLSFPGARENLQWGDDLCFKIGGKIFAIPAVDSVPPKLCFKCAPEKFAELTEYEGIIPAPYVGRHKWVLLQRLDVLRDAELQGLIRESYEMVSAKVKPAKKKARPLKKKIEKKLSKKL
jgi:predicted DNA-binding protein (MmcQ/YjbR family)